MSAIVVMEALRDHGVPLVLCSGWDRRGRPWQHGTPTGTTQHNTATGSATGATGRPSLEWLLNLGGSYPYANVLTSRGAAEAEGYPGIGGSPTAAVAFLASALSAWHSGKGGPSPLLRADRDQGHLTLLGIEHDARQVGPGSTGAITDAQVETGARIAAAVADLNGGRIEVTHTHTCWVTGCHGVAAGDLPTAYRKDDTYPDRPSSTDTDAYSAPFWRARAAAYLTGAVPPPPAPSIAGEVEEMILIHGRSPWLLAGGRLCPITDVTRQKAQAAGIPVFGVDNADWVRLVDAYGTMSMRGDG